MADNSGAQQTCFGCNGYLDSKEHDCLKAITRRINRQRIELNKLSQIVEKQRNVVSHHGLVVSLVKRVQDLESYKITEDSRTETLYRQIEQLKKQNKALIVALEDLGKANKSSNDNNNLSTSTNSTTDSSINKQKNNSSSSVGGSSTRDSKSISDSSQNNNNKNDNNNNN